MIMVVCRTPPGVRELKPLALPMDFGHFVSHPSRGA